VNAPLEGVRVLDLSRLLPGGYCTLLLADLGADVVKIEEPGRGDPLRQTPPLVDGMGAAHRALNRGKRSMCLDLKDPAGKDLLVRMGRSADVVVESFRPGVLDRLGVGFDRLASANPGLVWCAITGFGQDGPYRDVPGHDANYLGLAGVLSLGLPGEDPRLPGVQVADLGGGGMLGAVGILAALVRRSATGRGGFVDAAMLDGAVSWLSIHAGMWLGFGGGWGRGGPMLSGGLACYRVYRTGDGRHLTVAALEPRFWRAFCEGLGTPDLVERQFEPDGQAELAARVQEALLARDRDAWVEAFRGREACVAPVNDLGEALADRQVRHRGMVAEVDGVPVGPGSPVRLDGRSFADLRPAPLLGEHTEEILAEAGLAADEIRELRTRGVL
jgi:crotonobetainyl-CoA:carnitine CoA-transferase CaiB-like acyl-CoA transferase